jgi:putative flippase GtrA
MASSLSTKTQEGSKQSKTSWLAACIGFFNRFGRFAAVGTVGFLIDVSVLWAGMHWAGLGFYLGRCVSFLVSASATWYLNRTWTYSDRISAGGNSRQWLRYLLVSVLGAIVNYGTYCMFVILSSVAARYPAFAVAAGSIAGMCLNFTAYSLLVFRAGD